jgi:SAM-dependent methyltransferase
MTEEALDIITNRIKLRGDLPYVSIERQLELLTALGQFAFGRHLIQRGDLNGYWTHYAITHPQQGRLTGLNSENKPFTSIESFLLDSAPAALATQERFDIFKKETQKRLYDGVSLASIPCGFMAELLTLDFSQVSDFSLCGIDIDPEALRHSQQIAASRRLENHCTFLQKDAWDSTDKEVFDIITSNGLTIYEPDHQKVEDLYRQFYSALKPNGCLITSFLTPPPIPGTKTEWDLSAVDAHHALLQKIIFSDILEAKWQVYRPEELVKSLLLQVGFSRVEIVYDKAHIFPTAIAVKY